MSGHKEMLTAKVKATVLGVECPYCECWLEGFVGDPTGEEIVCESCGQTFMAEDEVELS